MVAGAIRRRPPDSSQFVLRFGNIVATARACSQAFGSISCSFKEHLVDVGIKTLHGGVSRRKLTVAAHLALQACGVGIIVVDEIHTQPHPAIAIRGRCPGAHDATAPDPSKPKPYSRNGLRLTRSIARRSVPSVIPSGVRQRLFCPSIHTNEGSRFASRSFQRIWTFNAASSAKRSVPWVRSPSVPPPSTSPLCTCSLPKRVINAAWLTSRGNVTHENSRRAGT